MAGESLDRRNFLAITAAGAASFSIAPLTAAAPFAALRAQARVLTSGGNVPSLSVAVIHHGIPVWVEAFGWADVANRVPASVSTRYAIASATKPFTGTLIAGLLGQGLMGLDDPIERHLGSIRVGSDPESAAITVREILQHRSGIPRHWRNFFKGQAAPPSFEEVAERHAFTTAARGKRYLYSNLNYGLLAYAAEQISGTDFHELLARRVLRPLGLGSAVPLNQQFERWTAAIPYEEDGTAIPPYRVDEFGARDLLMTALDLARFGQSHLAGSGQLDVRLRQSMLTDRAAIAGDGVSRPFYGLGWLIEGDSPAALFSFGHTGEGPGAASSLTIVPSESLVVATVANAQGGPAYLLNDAIVDAISPDFAARRRAHPYADPEPDAAALVRFAGDWTGELECPGRKLPVRVSIYPDGSGRFSIDGAAAALTGTRIARAVLSARSEAQIPTEEAKSWPHSTRLHVERTSFGLGGTLAAYASKPSNLHEQFWLSHRIRLRSEPAR